MPSYIQLARLSILYLLFMYENVRGWTCPSFRPRGLFSSSRSVRPFTSLQSEMPSNEDASLAHAGPKSTLSRVFKVAGLVRNVAENVYQRSNETSTQPNTTTWQVPEWMWEILPPPNGRNATKTTSTSYYGKPKWMKSAAFQGLTNWAFEMCDAAGDGRINRDELYAGILLVHLNLARYIGVTACTPLNRTESDQLFALAAAQDPLGMVGDGQLVRTIGRQAFEDIVVYSCAKISSRVVVYYVLLVLWVPFVTQQIMRGGHQLAQTLMVKSAHYFVAQGEGNVVVPRLIKYLVATIEWTVQYLLSVVAVTAVIPRIYVQLQARAPQWMLPSRAKGLRRPR